MRAFRDDGTEIEVDYQVEEEGSEGSFGPPGPCDEGPSGAIVSLVSAETLAGRDVTAELSDEERERIEIYCGERHEPDDYYDEPY